MDLRPGLAQAGLERCEQTFKRRKRSPVHRVSRRRRVGESLGCFRSCFGVCFGPLRSNLRCSSMVSPLGAGFSGEVGRERARAGELRRRSSRIWPSKICPFRLEPQRIRVPASRFDPTQTGCIVSAPKVRPSNSPRRSVVNNGAGQKGLIDDEGKVSCRIEQAYQVSRKIFSGRIRSGSCSQSSLPLKPARTESFRSRGRGSFSVARANRGKTD